MMPPEQRNKAGYERRYTGPEWGAVQLEERADAAPAIEGYAAVFYNGKAETQFELWDGAVERIMPGAFDRAVAEDDVRALFNHDPNQILGRTTADTLALTVDKRGLLYRNAPPDTAVGRDVITNIRRGDITGSSFGFVATDVDWRKEDGVDVREIRGVELWDVGPVTYPAYTTTTADARAGMGYSIEDLRTERAAALADGRALAARIARRNRARIVELGLTRG